MNYAEDRLDRRARVDDDIAEEATDDIRADLEHARNVFIHCADNLNKIKDAHELTGRTLRDCGRVRQSVFHFGMAWKLCHCLEKNENEWKAVGDYAQICEIAGFPEIGILALLYYKCRGRLDGSFDPVITKTEGNQQEKDKGCGCGMKMCGTSPCFLAFPSESTLIDDIINAFEALDRIESPCLSAYDILGKLAILTRSKSPLKMHSLEMHSFLSNKMTLPQPILQFWDIQMETSSMNQKLPTLIMLLLLKLLFSSPVGGSFLKLSCISVPYLSALLPPSSREGKRMARDYKSHWAYFVLIRTLVLGERMKKHRLGKVVHHAPVFDTVLCADDEDEFDYQNGGKDISLSCYLKSVIHGCSSRESLFDLPKVLPLKSRLYQNPPVYVVGDSHVLSLAWQVLRINATDDDSVRYTLRTATPFLTTGIKAYHLKSSTRFFTHYNLHACLQRLDTDAHQKRTVVLSAGEIDCREGIGGTLLKGYYRSCNEAVEETVRSYLSAASEVAFEYNLQILITPVAPHAYRSEKNGKSVGRAKRRETMNLWNHFLRIELSASKWTNVFLLDYEKDLGIPDMSSPVGYVLNPCYNADYTHTNNAIVPLVARAIRNSGCDLKCL
jgi:hypothetical protein